jgi:hypothetical protein
MTKKAIYCPVCNSLLGWVHGQDVSDTTSEHIISQHRQVAKNIVEIGLKIEECQAEFKRLSGMSSRDAIHDFVNPNVMRALGWGESEIDKRMEDLGE